MRSRVTILRGPAFLLSGALLMGPLLMSGPAAGRAEGADAPALRTTSAAGAGAAAGTHPSSSPERARGSAAAVAASDEQRAASAGAGARLAQRPAERSRGVNIIGGGGGAAAGAVGPGPLTNETLNQMLTNMGYEFTALAGGEAFEIKIEIGTWSTYQVLSLSPDTTVLWFSAFLLKHDDLKAVPQEKLLAMMSANGSLGYPFFQLNAESGRLSLMQAIPNEGLTPVKMREYIESFARAVTTTAPAWQP